MKFSRASAKTCIIRAFTKAGRAIKRSFAGCFGAQAQTSQQDVLTGKVPGELVTTVLSNKDQATPNKLRDESQVATPAPLVPYSDTEADTPAPLGLTPGTTAIVPYVPTPPGLDATELAVVGQELSPLQLSPELLGLIDQLLEQPSPLALVPHPENDAFFFDTPRRADGCIVDYVEVMNADGLVRRVPMEEYRALEECFIRTFCMSDEDDVE